MSKALDLAQAVNGEEVEINADKLTGLEANQFLRSDLKAQHIESDLIINKQNDDNEGGQLNLERATNSDLQSNISIDTVGNRIRLFAKKSNGNYSLISTNFEENPDGEYRIWHQGIEAVTANDELDILKTEIEAL
jgi:hypothetical protein